MGTILASKIVDDVEDFLSDSVNAQYTSTRLLKWLNVIQRLAVVLKPDLSVRVQPRLLVAGAKQTIASDAFRFIRITTYMGTNGTTPGKAVFFATMDELNEMDPDWRAATAVAQPTIYTFDERDPKTFYVYPPGLGTGYVEIVENITSANIAAIGNAITLDDIQEPVLINGVLYLAYLEDSAHSLYAQQRAQYHHDEFLQLLGRADLLEKQDAPGTVRTPGEYGVSE